MPSNADPLAQLRSALEQAQQQLLRGFEQLVALEAREQATRATGAADVTGSLKAVHLLSQKETDTLGQARAQGQGPGLYKALDDATAIEHERAELVHDAMDPSHREKLDEVLTRLQELEKQQRKLLVDELGKFEAQGLRGLLDTLTTLGQQQRDVVEQLMVRRRSAG